MARPQLPPGQAVGGREVGRLLEPLAARPGVGDVGDPPEHLERLARHRGLRGARWRRRARSMGQLAGVDDAALVEGDVGRDRVDPGGQRRVVGAGPARAASVSRAASPASPAGQRRAGEHEQQVGDVGACPASRSCSTSGRPSVERGGRLAGGREDLHEHPGRRRARPVRRAGRGAGRAPRWPRRWRRHRRPAPVGRSRRAARPPPRGSPAASARSAASSHTAPGSPGLARSTAGQAREARSRRSGGSSSPSTASRDSACRNRKPSPSTSMIWASTAARSASTAARPSTSATPGRSSQSNRRPSSAAAWMIRRAVGSSAASRWRIDCSTSIRDRWRQRSGGRPRPSSSDEGAGGHQPGEELLDEERDAVAVRRASTRGRRAGPRRCPGRRRRRRATSSGGRASRLDERDAVVPPEARQRSRPPAPRVASCRGTGPAGRGGCRRGTRRPPSVSTSAQCRSSRRRRVARRPGERRLGEADHGLGEEHR